jgi:hypothetical protein
VFYCRLLHHQLTGDVEVPLECAKQWKSASLGRLFEWAQESRDRHFRYVDGLEHNQSMMRLNEKPLFYRKPAPNEGGEASDFVLIRDEVHPDEWAQALKSRPYLYPIFGTEFAIRNDKALDSRVMGYVWRVILARPMKGPPSQLAMMLLLCCKSWMHNDPELALMFARAAQSTQPSAKGAKLATLAEKSLTARRASEQ